MTSDKRNIGSGLNVLDRLNNPARGVLEQYASVRAFAPGEVLWTAGEQPQALLIVIEGTVRVVRAIDGRQHVVHVEGPGGTLGDVALFGNTPYPATAIAATRARCMVIPPQVLHAAIAADPEFALTLLSGLAQRVRGLINRLDRVTHQNILSRVAEHVLRRATAAHGPFTLGTTQQELAEELGTVRELIVRSLAELRERGALHSAGRGRYQVIDIELLRTLSSGAMR